MHWVCWAAALTHIDIYITQWEHCIEFFHISGATRNTHIVMHLMNIVWEFFSTSLLFQTHFCSAKSSICHQMAFSKGAVKVHYQEVIHMNLQETMWHNATTLWNEKNLSCAPSQWMKDRQLHSSFGVMLQWIFLEVFQVHGAFRVVVHLSHVLDDSDTPSEILWD